MSNKGNYGMSPYSLVTLDNTVQTAADTPHQVSFVGDQSTGLFYKGAGQFGLGGGASEAANVNGPTFTVSGWFAEGVGTVLTAAGSSILGAPLLNGNLNFIGSAVSATGVALPCSSSIGVGAGISIFNSSLNNLKVYGSGGDTIDGTTGTTGVTLSTSKRCTYFVSATGTYISAQLGAVSA